MLLRASFVAAGTENALDGFLDSDGSPVSRYLTILQCVKTLVTRFATGRHSWFVNHATTILPIQIPYHTYRELDHETVFSIRATLQLSDQGNITR